MKLRWFAEVEEVGVLDFVWQLCTNIYTVYICILDLDTETWDNQGRLCSIIFPRIVPERLVLVTLVATVFYNHVGAGSRHAPGLALLTIPPDTGAVHTPATMHGPAQQLGSGGRQTCEWRLVIFRMESTIAQYLVKQPNPLSVKVMKGKHPIPFSG